MCEDDNDVELLVVYVAAWDEWQSAIMAFDDRQDRTQLLMLLQSGQVPSQSGRMLLADLLRRSRLHREFEKAATANGSSMPSDALQRLAGKLRANRDVPLVLKAIEIFIRTNVLVRGAGRPQAARYERSVAQARMLCAKLETRAYRRASNNKISVREATEKIGPLHRVKPGSLAEYMRGKPAGGIRRIRDRARGKE